MKTAAAEPTPAGGRAEVQEIRRQPSDFETLTARARATQARIPVPDRRFADFLMD
jgi:hypothetical protein